MYDKRAAERMRDGQAAGGRGHKKNSKANLPESFSGQARDEVGKVLSVSGKSVDYATKVIQQGIPELVQAVDEAA
jgi:hypothetical protein